MTREQILKTEWNPEIDELCKNRMVVSFHKYGPIAENYGNKLVKALDNLKKRLELYEQTHNTEYLLDVRNFCDIEFQYPSFDDAHFDNKSESPGLGGMTYRDIERLGKE